MFYHNLDREDLKNEEWRIFPNNKRYSVSNLGRVKNNKTGRVLKQSLTTGPRQGYCKLELKNNGKSEYLRVHRMVMMTFNPIERPEEFQVDHINGIRTDNRLENLRWNTALDNSANKKTNRENISVVLQEKIVKHGYDKVLKYLQSM